METYKKWEDESSNGFILRELLNNSITVYKSEITEIEEMHSEFQGNITIYYMVLLKNIKIGPKLHQVSNFREKAIKKLENLKVRINKKLFNENDLIIGDKVTFSGKLSKDNSQGYIVKNVRKIEKVRKDQFPYYLEKGREEEIREKRLEQKVILSLQFFAKRFPRIHLHELVKNIKVHEDKVIKIVKKLIKYNIIAAVYDDVSKGIEFNVMAQKIDELATTIEGWGKGDEEKVDPSFKKKDKKI